MISSDFRAEARRKLSGRWGKVACISLAYMAVFFVIGFINGLFPKDSLIESLYSLATAIIEIPLAFGLIISFYKLYHFEDTKAFDFLSTGFSNFKKAWGISLRIALKLIVPIILLVISYIMLTFGAVGATFSILSSSNSSSFGALAIVGFILLIVSYIWLIVKSYYYQLAYVVAADDASLTSKEAVLRSQELMQDKRGKLFCLQFSFIGWAILAAITFGIGMLWLLPYIQFAIFAFYDFATGNSNKVEIVNSGENTEENSNDDPIQNN